VLVFLDANVIVSDRFFRKARWRDLNAAAEDGRVWLAIPEVAVLEAAARVSRFQQETAQSIRAGARKASKAVKDLAEQAALQAEREGNEYSHTLRTLLEEHTIEVVPTPTVSHDELAGRAIRRNRPFDDSGSGYRDTLHWFALLDYAARDEEVVLVSGDRRAFYAGASSNAPHPDLLEDLKTRNLTCTLTLARSMMDVTVPGVFRAEELEPEDLGFDLEAALLEELNAAVLPTLDLQPGDINLDDVDSVFPLRFDNLRLRSHHIRQYYVDDATEMQVTVRADLTLRTSTLAEQDELLEDTRSVRVDLMLDTSTSASNLGPLTVTEIRPVFVPTARTLDAAAQFLTTFARVQQRAALPPTSLKNMQKLLASVAQLSSPSQGDFNPERGFETN
jgi:hypothetical protein